jgi:hypothetical protein
LLPAVPRQHKGCREPDEKQDRTSVKACDEASHSQPAEICVDGLPKDRIALASRLAALGFVDVPHQADPKQVFSVQDGMLRVSGDGYGGLITKKPYRDYHLIVEFKWGDKTWGDREHAARDSGILVHGWGPDGGFGNTWMTSIEAQIIEGGVGDILVLSGKDPESGEVLTTSLTAEITKDRDGEKVWKKGGDRITLSSGRINWYGRDVDWVDKIGFRGEADVESPRGQWTRLEVIADGAHLLYRVNGVVVNEGFDAKPDFGKITLQTEQAEMFVRRFELWPLGKAPKDDLKQ